MIARASSGSKSSISSIEPLMSANKTVIVLRSPSTMLCEAGTASARSASTPACEMATLSARCSLVDSRAETIAASDFAHSPQNLIPRSVLEAAARALDLPQCPTLTAELYAARVFEGAGRATDHRPAKICARNGRMFGYPVVSQAPSTKRFDPEMYEASSLARKRAAAAMSSGVPARRSGMRSKYAS
jgi:hypothetical protein